MIIVEDGRPKSVYTDGEREEDLEAMVAALSEDERVALMALMDDESGALIRQVVRVEYERDPVSPIQFLEDDYYLGVTGSRMFPVLKQDFVDLFEGEYTSAVLGGSIGWGKSFMATCALSYVIYLITCMRNPQATYGLSEGSLIEFVLVSITNKVIRARLLPALEKKLAASPYFTDYIGFNTAKSLMEIRIPSKGILVSGGSTQSVSIGGDVFGGLIDEISFMHEAKGSIERGMAVRMDRGEAVASGIIRRMKTRFQKFGKLPGLLLQISSKERPVAYIEKLIDQAKQKNDPTLFVREHSIIDVKSRGTFSVQTFKVAAGNERVRPMLDPSPEQVKLYEEAGLKVLDIPIDFRDDFETDLEGSLREIAGVSTEAISPYIQRIDKIYEAQDRGAKRGILSPLDDDEWISGTRLPFIWERVAQRITTKLPQGGEEIVWEPLRHPSARRHAHIDLSVTGDAAGLVIGHASDWIEVKRRDRSMKEYRDIAPVVETDLSLRIKPPPGDEIDFGAIREIVYLFAEHGFLFHRATFDSYQSVEPRQQFRKKGIDSDLQSIDSTTAPYDTAKDALYEGRLLLCSPCDALVEELVDLRRVVVKRSNGLMVKVDHPTRSRTGGKGRKDVADGLAGVVFSIANFERGDVTPIVKGGPADSIKTPNFDIRPGKSSSGDAPLRKIVRMPFDR